MSRPGQHARHAYAAAIAFRLDHEGEVLAGSTVNLSRGGLCATVAQPIRPGTDLEVDIQLVFEDDRQSEPLRVPGRLAWCTELADGYQIGITFCRLDTTSLVYLMTLLRHMDPDRPRGRDSRPPTVDERFACVW
jgi:hypothetical protein